MRLMRVPDDPPPARPPEVVATIGNFDGVHRGHRALIGKVIERAAELGVQSAVVTFDPHARLVIRPHVPLRLLSTVEEKAEFFDELGIDHVLVWRFDKSVQHTSAEQFLRQLDRWVRLRRLLHGPGFALGRRREGTAPVLAEIGRRMGFGVEEVTPYTGALVKAESGGPLIRVPPAHSTGTAASDGILSSTAIRALIADGHVRRATQALGRPPTLTGVVVEGEKVGHALGFPTANLRFDAPLAIPADGVYAAWAELSPFTPAARRLPAAVSIGTRPTFDGKERAVEAYLLDFAGNLYGQRLRLHFIARLRGQERFESVDALVAQMARDVQTTRALLTDQTADGAELLAADG
ncbi:MAG: bifunctional riboflavin kinase/FAD synthetase [Chloroflexota bacterium]